MGQGVWNHVAVTYDATEANTGINLYLNGVLVDDTDNSGGSYTAMENLGAVVKIGAAKSSGIYANGKIADVRIYAEELSLANIQVLASRINGDNTLGAGTTNLKGHWKLNESTIDDLNAGSVLDSSGNSHHGQCVGWDNDAAVEASRIHDAFSVNVHDNSTTTDGTFTVTQGKVEGKALTCLDFESGNDHINTGTALQAQIRTGFSMSMWVKPNDGITGANQAIFGSYKDSNNSLVGYIDSGAGKLSFRIVTDGNTKYAVEDSASFVNGANSWKHVVFTTTFVDASNATMKLYVDGVERTLNSTNNGLLSGGLDDYTSDSNILIGITSASGGNEWGFGGKIRSVRFNDNVLSVDQVASLYSNTYPVTPDHWWKIDDSIVGTSTTNVADTGSGTTSNGVATYFNNYTGANATSDWINGTLDLDSPTTDQLRISANGTLSAPRGNLAIGGAIGATLNSFENYGTFIHNNGTVTFDATADYGQRIQETATAATAFYNLTHNRSASSYHLYIKGDITVENTLLNTTGFVNLYGPNTLTMGTATSAGAITMTSSGIRFYNNDSSNYAKIYGASSLYPFVYTGNQPDIDTYSTNASHVALKNGDIQVAMTSDYQAGIVRLDGDMEFDAVTINANDDFDINGQRAHFGGVLTINSGGDLRTTNGGLIIADANLIANGSIEDYDNADVNMIVNGGTGHDWRLGASGGGGHWCENVLTNGTVTHGGDQIGPSSVHPHIMLKT